MDLYAERPVLVPAGGIETVHFVGAHLRLLAATGPVRCVIDGRKAENFGVGIGLPVPQGYERIQFENDAGVDVALIVAFSAAGVTDDRISINGNIALASDTGLAGQDDVTIATGGAAVVAAADAARRSILVSALAANTGSVRVGGDDVSAVRGKELAPGGDIAFDTTAAVWVYNGTGSDQKFSIVETKL